MNGFANHDRGAWKGTLRRAVLFAAALNVAACAVQVPLSTEGAASLKGRRLTTLVGRQPPFHADDKQHETAENEAAGN